MPALRNVGADIAPPLIAYYGLRAAGVSEYIAVLSATVLAGVKVCYDAIRARRLDPFAGYLLLTFGLSLAVGLATTNPRLVLAGNTLVNGIGGLIFLGSCVVRTPLTQIVAERIRPEGTEADAGLEGAQFRRRIDVRLSAMWGLGLLLEAAVRLFVIAALPVDAANGTNSVISLATIGALMTATFFVSRRARARWEANRAPVISSAGA